MVERAIYVERGTMARQRVVPVAEVDAASVPYFAMILVPGPRWVGEAA
jgi:precorrin-2/cobalt-factor-2 C20-methyltransferase